MTFLKFSRSIASWVSGTSKPPTSLRGASALRPDEDPLGAHVHVDAVDVPAHEPVQRLWRQLLGRLRQLGLALAPVALAVAREVLLVDARQALDEHHRRLVEAAAMRL